MLSKALLILLSIVRAFRCGSLVHICHSALLIPLECALGQGSGNVTVVVWVGQSTWTELPLILSRWRKKCRRSYSPATLILESSLRSYIVLMVSSFLSAVSFSLVCCVEAVQLFLSFLSGEIALNTGVYSVYS